MVADSAGERWPLSTGGPPLTRRRFDPDPEQPALAFVDAAAEAEDAAPLGLAELNDRIDPDYVDPLLVEFPADPPAGVRVAVEVSSVDVSVVMRDDMHVDVYPAGGEPNQLESSSTVEHDWPSAHPLLWSIGRAVAMASEEQPSTVTTRLVERFDADAVNRLLRPLADGSERTNSRLLLSIDGFEVAISPDGSIAVEPSLAALERSGAALLLAGSVPEQEFDRVSATLLGDPDEAGALVFVLHGRGVEAARRRLSIAGASPSAGTVVDHRATGRAGSASTTDETQPLDQEPEIVPVSGGVRALPEAVRETIGGASARSTGGPRLCVDSLESMIDSDDLEATSEVVEALSRIVREQDGVGTFLLPVAADSDPATALAPQFDAIVELRTSHVGVEQRWRLTGTGHETPWFPTR